MCYEDVCDRPETETDRLFTYLGQPAGGESLQRALAARSATHRRGSAVVTGADPVSQWMQHVTEAQRQRADELLAAFGLDVLYGSGDPRPRCKPSAIIGTLSQAA